MPENGRVAPQSSAVISVAGAREFTQVCKVCCGLGYGVPKEADNDSASLLTVERQVEEYLFCDCWLRHSRPAVQRIHPRQPFTRN